MVLLDSSMVLAGAVMLWHSGGRTVVDGAWSFQVGCVLAVALALVARPRLVGSLAVERIVIGIEVVGLAALIAVWLSSGRYLVGWLATFAAFVLMIASMWQLLAIIVTRRPPSSAAPPREGRARICGSLSSVRSWSVGGGLAALVVLTPVHGADAGILSGLVVLISGAALLSFAVRTWVSALARTS
ncbi:hypothetical protein [Microbacterium sp.]|uniref:hypothetical protein n=1 Tax=Microbacterium sp. TaxID=51671 RepID=UPI00289DA96C|nr:hypothetical protein [Microbacterium sp.]